MNVSKKKTFAIFEKELEEKMINEKYFYLDTTLPVSSSVPENILKGDVMLFGDDCLVVFYESFKTNYSYTKIGHIDNLPDLSGEDVTIQFMSNL